MEETKTFTTSEVSYMVQLFANIVKKEMVELLDHSEDYADSFLRHVTKQYSSFINEAIEYKNKAEGLIAGLKDSIIK